MLELRKPGWIITTYLLASYLLDNYVMMRREEQFKKFLIKFYQEVQRSSETGDKDLIEYNLAISRGTISEKHIRKRHKTILIRFLEYAKDLVPLDPKRDFTEEERLAIFRIYGGKCLACGRELHDEVWHVHHKIPWSQGGKTTIENGELLCNKCHIDLHKI